MSNMKKSKAELLQALKPFEEYEGRRILHQRSGHYYLVRDVFLREGDLTVRFTYADEQEPRLKFDRPIAELFDGRFRLEDQEASRNRVLRRWSFQGKQGRNKPLQPFNTGGRLSADPI